MVEILTVMEERRQDKQREKANENPDRKGRKDGEKARAKEEGKAVLFDSSGGV